MNLDSCLQVLGSIRDRILRESGPGNIHEICQQFLEVVGSMLAWEESDFEEELQGLTSSLDLLATLLSHFPHSHGTVKPLVQKLFSECARKVLGVEFQKLKEDDDQRASFMAAVEALCIPTQDASVRRLFMALQWTLENCWAHPTLVSMMKGEDIEETKALHYLEKLELGEVFRLRIELLVESGCDQYALNLCNWCVRSSLYRQDVFVRQTQLLLLHKFGKLQDFYNQCWTLECCVGIRMVESLLEDEDKRAVCLTLAQTFLLQDWMQPEKRCCTKELLRLWMHAQRLSESDNEEFLSSVSKVAQITRVPTQLVLLIEVMEAQFGSEFLSFCTELGLRALKLDRHRLDSARVKKEDEEADSAADGLAKTCRQISQLYQEHHHMCLSSLLTALYLDPKPDLFFSIESKMSQPHKRSPPRINNVDQAMFKELLDLVEGLRPIVLHPRHGWKEIKKTALFHLENAGYSYDAAKNTFTNLEELLIQKRQTSRKKSKSKTTKQKRFKQFVPKLETPLEGGEVSELAVEQVSDHMVGVDAVADVKKGLEFVGADSSENVYVEGPEATVKVQAVEVNDQTAVCGNIISSDLPEGVVPPCVQLVPLSDIENQPVSTSTLYPNAQLVDYNCMPETLTSDGTAVAYEPHAVNSSTDIKSVTAAVEQQHLPVGSMDSLEPAQVAALAVKDESSVKGESDVIAPSSSSIVAVSNDGCTTVTQSCKTENASTDAVTSTASSGSDVADGTNTENIAQIESAALESPVENSVETKSVVIAEDNKVDSTTVGLESNAKRTDSVTDAGRNHNTDSQGNDIKMEAGSKNNIKVSKADPEAGGVSSEIKEENGPQNEQFEIAETGAKTNDLAALNFPAVSTSSENAHVAAIQSSQDQALVESQQSVSEGQPQSLIDGQHIIDSDQNEAAQAALIGVEIAPTNGTDLSMIHVNAQLNAYTEAEMVVDANQHAESQQIDGEYPVTEGEVLMTIDEPQKVIVCPAEETVLEGRAVLIGDEMTVETEVESTTQGPDTSIVQEAVDEVEVSTELSPDSTSKGKSFNGQFGETSPVDSPAAGSGEVSDEEEEVLFSCAYCSKPFSTMAQRRRHQEWLCSLKVAKHSCQKCGRTYQSERSLYKHIRVAHRLSVEDVLKNVILPSDLDLKPCSVSLERLGTAILDRYNITIKVKKKKAQPKSLMGPNGNSVEKMDSLKTIKKEKKAIRPGDSPTKRPARRSKVKKPVKKPGQTEEQILIDGLIMPQTFDGGLENGYQEEEVMEEAVMEIPYIQGPITEAYNQLQTTAPHGTTVILHPHTPVVTPAETTAPTTQLRVMTSMQIKQPELLVTHVQAAPQRPQPTTPVKSATAHIPGTPRDHSCRYCREKYTNERARLKHERDCVANPHSTEEVVCEFCGGIYKGLLSLNSHLLARHTPDAPKGDKEEHSRSGVVDGQDDKQKRMAPKKKLKLYKNIFVYMIIEIHCGSCDSIFGDKNYCRQHQRKSCSEDNGMRKIVKYCCKYCEEAFMTMNNCYQHCLKCEKCPTGDPVKDAETSIYRCTEKECKRAFISQVSLKAHILSVHYIRGNATNVRFTPGASSKSRAKKAAAVAAANKKDGTPATQPTSQEPAADNPANFNLAGLSAAEFEQAINMPNVDGFLKLLEDDTLIDSHWDLSEPFQGQGPQTASQSQAAEAHAAEAGTTAQVVVTQVVTTANHHTGAVALPPLPSWVKTTSRTQWNTVPGGAANTVQPIGQPQVLQVGQIPHHLKPTLIQAAPGLTTARLTAPQAKLLQDKTKARPKVPTLVNAPTHLIIPQALTIAAAKKPQRPRPPPRPKPKSPQESPEPDTSLASSPSIKQEDDESEEDGLPKKKPHFGGRQPWLVNGKKFMTFRNAPMLRTTIHMCKKCHSKFEDEVDGNAHVEKCGDDKNILLKTRRFYCVYCDHVSESAKKCRDHLIKTCLPAMNIDPATVLNPRYECKEEGCDKQFFVRFFLIKHMVSDHGREREEFKSKKKDIDDFSLPSELNERLPDYIKECLPQEFTKRRKEGKDMVTQRRKQRKESDSTTFTEGSEVSQMSIGSSGQPNYLETSSGAGSVQNIQEQLKEEEALEQQYMMQVGEGNNAALVTAPMVAQYVQMSTVTDEAGVVQNVGALLLQCATSESVQLPPNIATTSSALAVDSKIPSITRCQEPPRRNSQGDLEEMGQAIQQGAQDVSNALQNAQQDLTPTKVIVGAKLRHEPDTEIILASHIKGKVNEEYLKLSQQQTVWATRNKNVVPVMSIPGPISSTLPISSNHVLHSTAKGVLSGQVHLHRGTQPTTLMPPVVMTTHVTGGNIARPQAVRPGQLISPQAPSTPASSQISESVDSESSPSPSPEPLPEPEDGRISPVVDALLARIKAKTKKLEEKNRLKAANKQKMSAAAKRRKRDSSSGSIQSAMSPGASSVSSLPSSVPAPSPGQTPTPPLPQPGSLTAQTIFNHIHPASPDPDRTKEELRCEECDLAFNTKSLLTYHQKYSCAAKFGSHNKMDDRVCRYCKATFHHKVALKYHVGKCRTMMLENAQQPSTLATVEEDSVESVNDRDSTLNSPTPKKKALPMEGPIHIDQSRENLMKTLERKVMCHADVVNPMSPRAEWHFKCKYCQEDFGSKLMSLHSHVVARHPDMYKKARAKDHSIKLLQSQNSITNSYSDLANADDLSLLSLDTSNDLALISDLALLTAEMEASKGTFSKLSAYDHDKKLVCDLCENEREFEKESSLLYHLKCVHGKDIPKLDLHCPQCKGETFENDVLLHEHMKSKHGIDSLLMPSSKLPFNLRQAGHLESQVYHVQGQIFPNQNNQQQGQGDSQSQAQGEQVTATVDTSQLQTQSPAPQGQAVEGQVLNAPGQVVMTSMSADQISNPTLVSSGGLSYASVPITTSLAGSGMPVVVGNSISMTVPTTSVTLQTADGQIIHTSVPTSLLQDGGLGALSGAQVLPTGEIALPLITTSGQPPMLLQTVAPGQVLFTHHSASPHGQSSPALTASSSQASPAQPKKKPVKKKFPEGEGNDDKAKKKRTTPAKPRPSPSGTGASFKPELDPEKWKCRYCDMGFPRRQDMRDHIKYTHRVPGAYPGPLPTKSSTVVKDRDDDNDPHEAVLRQGTDILQQALSMIGEGPSTDTGDSLASTSDSAQGSNIVIQQTTDGGQMLAPQVLDMPVSMDFDMGVSTLDNSGHHQNMTVLPIQQLGLVSAASTIDPSLLLQHPGITMSTLAQMTTATSTVSIAQYSQEGVMHSGQETSMEAEINDVLRQASMAAGIFEDEPGDSSNSQDGHDDSRDEDPVAEIEKPAHYSATEQDDDDDDEEAVVKDESIVKDEADSSQLAAGNGNGEPQAGNGDQHDQEDLNTSSDDNQADTSTEDFTHNQTDGHVDSRRSLYKAEELETVYPEPEIPSSNIAEADSTNQAESVPMVESSSDTPDAMEAETVAPVVDQNGSDTQGSPASSQATIIDSAPVNQKTDDSSEATELPSTAESSGTESPAHPEVSKKDLFVKIDKLALNPPGSMKVDESDTKPAPAESGSRSPGQGERWSLRPRKRKESAEEGRSKRGRTDDADKEGDDDTKKTRGRRKSTDSNVSSGASEHSSVSRNSGANTPRTSGSPRSRRTSEDSRGGVSRRVLRNTVKTVPEEEAPRPVGRRASKNK